MNCLCVKGKEPLPPPRKVEVEGNAGQKGPGRQRWSYPYIVLQPKSPPKVSRYFVVMLSKWQWRVRKASLPVWSTSNCQWMAKKDPQKPGFGQANKAGRQKSPGYNVTNRRQSPS